MCHIFFDQEDKAHSWHTEVLNQQGYLYCRVKQYRKLRLLDKGGFSKVYLCKHKNSRSEYALKKIYKKKIDKTFGR